MSLESHDKEKGCVRGCVTHRPSLAVVMTDRAIRLLIATVAYIENQGHCLCVEKEGHLSREKEGHLSREKEGHLSREKEGHMSHEKEGHMSHDSFCVSMVHTEMNVECGVFGSRVV